MLWSESVIPPLIMRGSGFLIFDPLPYNLIMVVFWSSSPYLVKFGKEKELISLAWLAMLWFLWGAGLTGKIRPCPLQVLCSSNGGGREEEEKKRKGRPKALVSESDEWRLAIGTVGNYNKTVVTSVSYQGHLESCEPQTGSSLRWGLLPLSSGCNRVRKETQIILRLSANGNFSAFSILPFPFKLGGLGVSLLPLWVWLIGGAWPQATRTEVFPSGGVARWGGSVSPAPLTLGVAPTGILKAGKLGSVWTRKWTEECFHLPPAHPSPSVRLLLNCARGIDKICSVFLFPSLSQIKPSPLAA